jgi:transcription-repair coupling factor (superfamily II helicase)
MIDFEREIGDRFGPPPPEVENLLFQLRVKALAAKAELSAVTVENAQILLQHPDPEARFGSMDLDSSLRRSRRGLWLGKITDPNWQGRLVEVLRGLAAA